MEFTVFSEPEDNRQINRLILSRVRSDGLEVPIGLWESTGRIYPSPEGLSQDFPGDAIYAGTCSW